MTSLKVFVSHFIEGVRGTVALNREAQNLDRLSDRELNDIGLSRAEVRLENRRPVGA